MPLGKSRLIPDKRLKAKASIDTIHLSNGYYYDDARKPNGRKKGCLHPSQLASCRRAQQLDILRARTSTPVVPIIIRRIWDNGHYIESRLAKALAYGLEKAGGSLVRNIKCGVPELMLYGENDGVITLRNGDKWVIDFKSQKRDSFKEQTRPSKGYTLQAHSYMLAMNIPQSVYYFENKDSCNAKQYLIPWDQKLWDETLEEVIDYILLATYEGRLVKRDEDKCSEKMCPFYNTCFSESVSFESSDRRNAKDRRRLKMVAEVRGYD